MTRARVCLAGRCLAAIVLVVAPAVHAQGASPVAGRPSVTGTYTIALCRARCTPDRPAGAYATGFLVLAADSIVLGAVPPARRREIEEARYYLGTGAPNGCFSLRRNARVGNSYAGLLPVAQTTWRGDSTGTVHFVLYRSPDAGYDVRAVIKDGVLRGVGRSWGVGEAQIDAPADVVVGRRLGPPDARRCVE